ncbi:MAG TPA: hypothetical protein VHX66_12135 [Solirubrobacteraceae bacterium]|jgi:hypothetical protein|nr:hypothetical protein [Solirubrobacteraceae bacterium]
MDDTLGTAQRSNCELTASADRWEITLLEAVATLRLGPCLVLEGPARDFADDVYGGKPEAFVWDAKTRYRAPDKRGDRDRLEQLRWAVAQRCLGCGGEFQAHPHYGVRRDGIAGDVLCADCGAHEPTPDRLRRGLARFVLDVRDAWAD